VLPTHPPSRALESVRFRERRSRRPLTPLSQRRPTSLTHHPRM